MHRGYTSVLRNGILKQHPPVFIRFGAFIEPNNIETNKRLWHNQYAVKRDNNQNIRNEEELRKACVQMIEQCQVMVRKLQLHYDRPNSKSATRRRNPRNNHKPTPPNSGYFNSGTQQNNSTLYGSDKAISTINEQITGCRYPTTNKQQDNGKIDNIVPSFGPKLLQSCVISPTASCVADPMVAPVVIQTTPPVVQYVDNSGDTTGNRVHSSKKSSSAVAAGRIKAAMQQTRKATATQSTVCPEHMMPIPRLRSPTAAKQQGCTVESQDSRATATATTPSSRTTKTRSSTAGGIALSVRAPSLECVRRETESLTDVSDRALIESMVPNIVGTTTTSRIPTRASGLLALPLKDTPMQNRLRAQKRARAKPNPARPPIRSQAERAIDTICQATISCLESFGRLPRILQTPSFIQQHCQPPIKQRCAKNSMPHLPNRPTTKKRQQSAHNQSNTEQFLTSTGDALQQQQQYHVPPKILADCHQSKQLYSRKQNFLEQSVNNDNNNDNNCCCNNILIKSSIGNEKKGGVGNIHCYRVVSHQQQQQNQQIRSLMTTKSNHDEDEQKDACTGKLKQNALKPKCTPKKKQPVCRPAPSVSPCQLSKVSGPCKSQLQLATSTTSSKAAEQLNWKHSKQKVVQRKEVKEAPKPPGRCQKPPSAKSVCPGLCQGDANICTAPPRPTNRLRKPPVPKHLLKRQPRCFQPCMSTALEMEQRPQSNCERMLRDKSKQSGTERPPDPMKQPKNKCVEMRRCKQEECAVLHIFPPPPRTDDDLPPAVLPYPKNMCGEQDPDAVPPWELKCDDQSVDNEVKCNLRRPIMSNSSGKRNDCGPMPPKVKPPPPYCGYRDDESFQCQSEADLAHPTYPDPVCPPLPANTLKPLKFKNRDVFKDVPCIKRSSTCEERLEVDTYCEPCYAAKQLHQYSGTAYYDLHNYMAGRRRRLPGPNHKRRQGKPWRDESPSC